MIITYCEFRNLWELFINDDVKNIAKIIDSNNVDQKHIVKINATYELNWFLNSDVSMIFQYNHYVEGIFTFYNLTLSSSITGMSRIYKYILTLLYPDNLLSSMFLDSLYSNNIRRIKLLICYGIYDIDEKSYYTIKYYIKLFLQYNIYDSKMINIPNENIKLSYIPEI